MPSASELVQSCTTVFTLPEIYFRVRDVVDDPNSTMDDLADVLKLDPAISARLLRIVNSPFYGFPKQIDTVSRAVHIVGMQAIKDLVTATTVGRTFSGMPIQLMDGAMFWRKSVLCALLAGKIAKSCGIEDSERFFIGGLLRDIGHLVLYQTIPQRAQSALIEAGYLDSSLAEVEQANIGCDFAEVGAELIRSWGMPAQIEQAIRCQLSPYDAGEFIIWPVSSPITKSLSRAGARPHCRSTPMQLPPHGLPRPLYRHCSWTPGISYRIPWRLSNLVPWLRSQQDRFVFHPSVHVQHLPIKQRAAVFVVDSCETTTFAVDPPALVSGPPGTTFTRLWPTVSVDPHLNPNAYIWLTYTGTNDGDTATVTRATGM
jgi:HD-like signal output (HDOD) protein